MDRISRIRRHAAVALVGLGTALAPVAQAFAETSTTDDFRAAEPIEWSTEHAGAEASGISWVEGVLPESHLYVEGELTGPADGCASVWEQWSHDNAAGPKKKIATACDGETVEVRTARQYYLPTHIGRLELCAGETNTDDCGEQVRISDW